MKKMGLFFSFILMVFSVSVTMSGKSGHMNRQIASNNSYGRPLEIIKNDGENLVIRVNKEMIKRDSSEKQSSDFILYYDIHFNGELVSDKDNSDCSNQVKCLQSINLLNLDSQENEWRTITLPIKKRGKYTVSFFREAYANLIKNKINFDKDSGFAKKLGRKLIASFSEVIRGVKDKGSKTEKNTKKTAITPVWVQDFFVEPPHSISDKKIHELAQKYAPITFMHSSEEYLPASLEYIFNEKDVSEKLNEEVFTIELSSSMSGEGYESIRSRSVKFPYKDVLEVLPFYGDREMVLSSSKVKVLPTPSKETELRFRKGTKEDATVYYSYMENLNLFTKTAFINYHFLYPFDPKTGTAEKPAIAGHTFDRESVTIVLNLETMKPDFVIYGAHLANQLMSLLDRDNKKLQMWLGGRVKQYWNDIPKVDGTHPIISKAQGSHGVYPIKGNYNVSMVLYNSNSDNYSVDALVEGADGKQILYPSEIKFNKEKLAQNYSKNASYKIKNLELGRITSYSWNRALAFSGDMVDVLGPSNAKFPPFTAREFNIEKYVLGDECNIDLDEELLKAKQKLDEIQDSEVKEQLMLMVEAFPGCYQDISTREARREVYEWNKHKVSEQDLINLENEIKKLNSFIN